MISKINLENCEIVGKEMLHETIFLLEIHVPAIVRKAKPGNFVILMANKKGERTPITIADINKEKGTIIVVIQIVGKTSFILSKLDVGNVIKAVVGPLGCPTHIDKFGVVVLVAGGVGIPLAYPVAKALKDVGNYVISIIDARTKELLIWEEKINSVSNELFISTDDGSYGFKGFTTQLLEEIIKKQQEKNQTINRVFTVGPTIMMKFVADMTRKYHIKTIASLNSIMLDGTGMCGACRVTVNGELKFTCVDGPDFDAHLVDFDELIMRLRQYKASEELSYNILKEKRGLKTIV